MVNLLFTICLLGISSLRGNQFFDRILLFFMPAKFQPDYTFLRHVKLMKVHLFTIIQLLCFGILYAIKSIPKVRQFLIQFSYNLGFYCFPDYGRRHCWRP